MGTTTMRGAYIRLAQQQRTAATKQTATIDRDAVMRLWHIDVTTSPNEFFRGDVLDTNKLTATALRKFNIEGSDVDAVEGWAADFSEAVDRADAKCQDGRMSFNTALASEIF